MAAQLEASLAHEQSVSRLPSLSVALVRNGAICWRGALGRTGLDGYDRPVAKMQYRIGSISKTFAAVEVMRLRDEGVLQLNDYIGRDLEEMAELPFTIAQLLSHLWAASRDSGSLVGAHRRCPIRRARIVIAAPLGPVVRPGRRFHYSNTGYAVLGELIPRKRSKPFANVLHDELLEPLGMDRTTLRPVAPFAQGLAVHPDANVVLSVSTMPSPWPPGQLWSTIDNLARWSEVLTGRCPEILEPDTVAEMTEPIGLLDVPGLAWTGAHGLGLQLWNLGGRHRYGHSGSMPGFVAILVIDKQTKDVVIAITILTSGFRPGFLDDLFAIVSSEKRTSPPAFEPASASIEKGALASSVSGTGGRGPTA